MDEYKQLMKNFQLYKKMKIELMNLLNNLKKLLHYIK